MAAVWIAALLLAPVRAVAEDDVVARPPPSSTGNGPVARWNGTQFVAGANETRRLGADPVCDQPHPCDVISLKVPLSSAWWNRRPGGVVVNIVAEDGSDFDLYVFRDERGSRGRRLDASIGPGDSTESVFIPRAAGRYFVIVVPVRVAAGSYKGLAYVRVVRPTNGGPGFPATRVSRDRLPMHNEPAIAVNPLNARNVIAVSQAWAPFEGWKAVTYRSMDGGRTWRDNGPLPGSLKGLDEVVDVTLAFDDEGVAYLLSLAIYNDYNAIILYVSRDGGRTWGAPTPIPHAGTSAVLALLAQDKEWITVDNHGPDRDGKPGPLYACWSARTFTLVGTRVRAMVVTRSLDQGKSWSVPISVSDPAEIPNGCHVVTGPAGELYVIWSDFSQQHIRIVKSVDEGVTFTRPVSVTGFVDLGNPPNTRFRNRIFPSAGVGRDGAVTIVWPDGRYGDTDIFAIRSRDGGTTWGRRVRINDDAPANGHWQFQPAISVAPNGRIDVFFYDRRNDPREYRIDAFLARSTNGITWRNFRLTQRMWNPAAGAQGPTQFIGDYQAVLALDGQTIALWTDTRTGRQELWSTRLLAPRA